MGCILEDDHHEAEGLQKELGGVEGLHKRGKLQQGRRLRGQDRL
jgi:hypothetical protein